MKLSFVRSLMEFSKLLVAQLLIFTIGIDIILLDKVVACAIIDKEVKTVGVSNGWFVVLSAEDDLNVVVEIISDEVVLTFDDDFNGVVVTVLNEVVVCTVIGEVVKVVGASDV